MAFRSYDKAPQQMAARQAANILKQLQGRILPSVRTAANYEQALKQVALHCNQQLGIGLQALTPGQAVSYLEQRGEQVGQKTLDMERQAIQTMMQHVSYQLATDTRLPVVRSEQPQILRGRAYTPLQVEHIARAQSTPHAMATALAYAAGLRAHELLTLRPASERPADPRPALSSKWAGRHGEPYTVQGKGGLVREVRIPTAMAMQLEQARLTTPLTVTDRGVHYQQHYDLGGGQPWSNSFSRAAQRALGWSEGAHGLRHSYAQERLSEVQAQGYTYEQALETVSQEMGHFRPDITLTYLR